MEDGDANKDRCQKVEDSGTEPPEEDFQQPRVIGLEREHVMGALVRHGDQAIPPLTLIAQPAIPGQAERCQKEEQEEETDDHGVTDFHSPLPNPRRTATNSHTNTPATKQRAIDPSMATAAGTGWLRSSWKM